MTLSSLPVPDPLQNVQLILDEDNNTTNKTSQVYTSSNQQQPYTAFDSSSKDQQQTLTSLPALPPAGEQNSFTTEPLLYPMYPHTNANLNNHAKTNKLFNLDTCLCIRLSCF